MTVISIPRVCDCNQKSLFLRKQILLRKILFVLFALISIRQTAFSQYWQQQVNYSIDVSLQDKQHSLTGFEKIEYINNSPDTLHFIWFHIWPNAYKNDKTAFSDQLLQNGNTKFYFSDKEQKGYINRLDFKVDNVTAETEDHPQHIDIIKLILPQPLAPKQKTIITTPFHVKLPFNFSRSGYDGDSYQVTQWYPKPAVYDRNGWHPMPYLDQGEFYSEFGNFDVRITVPENYVVAATGELQNTDEKKWLKERASFNWEPTRKKIKKGSTTKTIVQNFPASANDIKILEFKQNNVHDFAWFADKRFIVAHDTCQLASGKTIDIFSYYTPSQKKYWKNTVSFAKQAVKTRSEWVGEYPFSVVSVVQGPASFGGGMEYPTITVISPEQDEKQLQYTIAHEISHNWFYGILGSNERAHPWMDEGMNSYYDNRYSQWLYGDKGEVQIGKNSTSLKNLERLFFESLAAVKKDQPVNTPSDSFSSNNYALAGYYKTAAWMEYLEKKLGKDVFDNAMQQYYQQWQFKHPQPQDFKRSIEESSGKNLDSIFALLDKKGILPDQKKSGTSIIFPFSPKAITHYVNHPSKNLLLLSPSIGFNNYDKLMLGGLLTNYKLPASPFQFFAAPMYATGSKQLVGTGQLNYSIFPDKNIQKVKFGIGGMFFSKNTSMDSNGVKVFENFYRLTPSVKIYLNKLPVSTRERTLEAKSFIIGETNFNGFAIKSTDGRNYVTSTEKTDYYVNQLTFTENNFRELYPYQYNIQLQQGKGFYRVNFTGNYFFNYEKGGGMNVRLFAGKFGYIGDRTKYRLSTQQFQPKLLGVTGEEDFTYSNYFLGRTASYGNDPEAVVNNRGLGGQQIMIRDGGLKLRLDQYDFLQGRSENWVAAINFTSSLPQGILPFHLPIKVFADIGSFSEAWDKNSSTSRFLYVAGLQLSLFKNLLNVYAPIFYSNEFKDNLQSLPEQNKFFKKLTFSIDILQFDVKKIHRSLDF